MKKCCIPYFIAIIFGFCVSACKKKDTTLPTLNVTNPLNNTSYYYNEYINIFGLAQDETQLKTIKAELFDNAMNTIGLSVEQQANTKELNFAMGLLLNDRYLNSGQYILKIAATDNAGNTKSVFKNINYTGLQLAIQDVFVINKPSVSSFEIHRLINLTTQHLLTVNGDFNSAIANPYTQQIVFSSNNNGKCAAYDIERQHISYEIPWQQTLSSYFKHLHYNEADKLTYLVTADNYVRGYNKAGTAIVIITPQGSLVPNYCFVQGTFVFVERKLGQTIELTSYYKNTNTLYNTTPLNGDIACIVKKNNDELYLFTNTTQTSTMHIYTIANGSIWSPINMPNGLINDAVSIHSNELFIAHQTGIFRYTYNNNSLVNWIPGINASKLYLDKTSTRLVAIVGNQIRYFDLQGNPAGIVTHNSQIEDILLLYNK